MKQSFPQGAPDALYVEIILQLLQYIKHEMFFCGISCYLCVVAYQNAEVAEHRRLFGWQD